MDFIVIGLPRSGTTWAANWLTSDGAICYHDPLASMTLDDLASHNPGRPWGVSCTALWLFPDFIAEQKCPVVVLDRALFEVNESLAEIGYPPVPAWADKMVCAASGYHAPYSDLFDSFAAEIIWKTLRPDATFDVDRHKVLSEMFIQPNFETWRPDQDILDGLKYVIDAYSQRSEMSCH